MRIKLHNGLPLINILAALLIIVIALIPSNVLRIILGLPFVFFFPGYALISALYPSKKSLSTFARIALSFGFSLVVTALVGLILNYTPFGIRLYPILVTLFIFNLIMSGIYWLRQKNMPEADKISISFNLAPQGGPFSTSRVLSIILVVVILGTLGTLSYVIATPKIGEKYTEFYILGTDGKATDYPKNLSPGQEGKVIAGIVNREQQTMSYRVEVRIDNLKESELAPITLEPEAKWEAPVSFKPDKVGENQKVDFLLFKAGENAPYMEPLHIWVNVK